MVFLRLTVKIFPREQQSSSSSFSLRSILGDRGSDREDATRASNATSAGKPASFLLVLTKPQDVSLGALAGMIRDKWVKLRPNAEPLQIKKLLDDDHEADDLDADMTVADVFVDNGLSQIDGRDQRRTVRVIQKPAPYAPPRFPSVSLDWDAAAEDFQRQAQSKKDAVQRFPAIPEEGSLSGSFSESRGSAQIDHGHQEPQVSDRNNGQDTPMKSVENEEEIPGSPQPDQHEDNPQVHEPDSQGNHEKAVEATPQHTHTTTTMTMDAHGHTRMESQELGSPTPTTRARRRSTSSRGRPAQRTISRMADMRTPPVEPEPVDEAVESADDQDEVPTPPGRRRTRSRAQSRRNPNEDSGEGAEEKDQDGDVGMDSVEGVDGNETTRLGKRKNSKEESHPNKEPRLDSQAREPSQETDRSTSPSALRKPSFSRTGRRTSFTDHSPPKPGLGLGITRSPSRKRPVMLDDSAGDLPPSQTSVLAASVLSSGVKDTAPEKDTTPSKLLTPFTEREGTKPLNSALRKHSPVDKHPEPRSVSFSGQKDIIPARPAPEPKSTPTPTPSTEQWLDKMQFPPTISSEHAKELVQQEKKKIERENKEMREDEAKLTRARETGVDPEHVRILEDLCSTRAWIANSKVGGVKMEKRVKQERQKVANLKKKLDRLEAKSGKKDKSETGADKGKAEKGKSEKGKGEKSKNKSEKQKDASSTEKAKSKKSKTSKSPEDASESTKPTGPKDMPNGPRDKGNDPKDKGKQKKATRRSDTEQSAEPAKDAAKPAEPAEHAEPAEPAEPAKHPESQSELTNGDVPAAAELDSGSQNQTSDAQQEARQEQADPQPQESHEHDKPEGQVQPPEHSQRPQLEPEPKQAEQLKTTPKKSETQSEPEPEPEPKQAEQKKPEAQENSDEQSDDLKLPAMPNVRSVEQSKPRSPAPSLPASKPAPAPASASKSKPSPKPTSKPTSPQKPALPQNQAENQSESESSSSDSESSSDEETSKPSRISQSQPQPQTNSRFSSPWARAHTPSQSQPKSQSQLHTQPFQAINRTSTRTSLSGLKNLMDQQKSEHDARVQQAKQASHQPRKDIFDPSSDSDDDDDDDSDSDSDGESKSSADEGDIQSSGTVGKLRRAISWRR